MVKKEAKPKVESKPSAEEKPATTEDQVNVPTEDSLLSIPELQKGTGVSDFILTAYLSSKQLLQKYKKEPDEKIMTLEEFKTDINLYKRKKIK